MESEIRPEVSGEAYLFREKVILEGDGPFPPELTARLTKLLEDRDFTGAFVALDQWRFSRLSPEEQREEQRAHRENVRLLKEEGLQGTLIVLPDDLIAPNNPYLDPKFAKIRE